MKKISIVVPCYNEEKRLLSVEFEKFAKKNRRVRFIFVNDGSTDKTLDIVKALAGRMPRIQYIDLKRNLGKAEAVRAGFLRAMNDGSGYIGYWDADLSTPLKELGHLVYLFSDPDVNIVMGSRVQLLGRKIVRKRTRHYSGRLFATLASIVLDLKVYDTQCGAKIFRTNETLHAVFSLPFHAKWTFDVEILARYIVIKKASGGQVSVDRTIAEYPLMEWVDIPDSKVKLKDAFIAIPELCKIYYFMNCSGAENHRKALLGNLTTVTSELP